MSSTLSHTRCGGRDCSEGSFIRSEGSFIRDLNSQLRPGRRERGTGRPMGAGHWSQAPSSWLLVPLNQDPEELFLHRPKANRCLSFEQREQAIVVVRLQIGDEPQQTPIADRTLLDAIASGDVSRAPPLSLDNSIRGPSVRCWSIWSCRRCWCKWMRCMRTALFFYLKERGADVLIVVKNSRHKGFQVIKEYLTHCSKVSHQTSKLERGHVTALPMWIGQDATPWTQTPSG